MIGMRIVTIQPHDVHSNNHLQRTDVDPGERECIGSIIPLIERRIAGLGEKRVTDSGVEWAIFT